MVEHRWEGVYYEPDGGICVLDVASVQECRQPTFLPNEPNGVDVVTGTDGELECTPVGQQ